MDRVPAASMDHFNELLAGGRLPSLTHLKLHAHHLSQLHLPSLLRDLELRGNSAELARKPVPKLTSITALGQGAMDRTTADLLRAAASSLQRLHIDAKLVSSSLAKALTSLHLSRLTDLTLSHLSEAALGPVTVFYHRHASQLLSLSLLSGWPSLDLSVAPLPELTSLTWNLTFRMSESTLQALHALAPKLTALHHLSDLPPSSASACERTLLRTVRIITSEFDLPEKLCKFPNLTDLSVGHLLTQHAKPFADKCAYMLTECKIQATRQAMYQLACYSRLRKLQLIIEDSRVYMPPLPALTNLTELHLSITVALVNGKHQAVQVDVARHFVTYCPALTLISMHELQRNDFVAFLALVKALDRRGGLTLVADCPRRWTEILSRLQLRWLTLRLIPKEP